MILTPQNTLIAVAADLEWPHFAPLAKQWRVVKTGIGKLNAVTTVLAAHYAQPFDVLVNLGSVGSNSKHFGIGHIVQCTQLIERDSAFSGGVIELPDLVSPIVDRAVLGTGDDFVEKEHLPPPDIEVVDMEGYALARIAHTLESECLVLKVISDHCTSFADWEKNAAVNSEKLARFFTEHTFTLPDSTPHQS